MLDLDSYFRRIGYTGPRAATLETLRDLQVRHALSIPFENLDAVAGRRISLDVESLQRKLVDAHRGGYCFEQNLLFLHVLSALGFQATGLAARVVWERPEGDARPRTHMLLFVELGEGSYLADVGFGGLTPTAPLRLEPDVPQSTPHETLRIVRRARDFTVEARVRGEWKPLYRFDLQAQQTCDIEVLNYYVSTHPQSPLIGSLIAARPADDRRFALRNGTLTVHHLDGRADRRQLATVAELRDVLAGTFGIAVPEGAEIDAALARVLG
jgi:N-hydroxyarylamine O-acetyltransferase